MKKLIFGASMICACALQASVVQFNYYGTITDFHGPFEPNFAGLNVGDQVSGSFSYDTAAVMNGGPSLANYQMINLSIKAGPHQYAVAPPTLEIDANGGYFWNAGAQTANHEYFLGLKFEDTIAPLVETDAFLRPAPDVSLIDIHYGTLLFYHAPESNITYFNFNIDRVTTQITPVPEAGPLAGVVVFSLGLLSFRQYTARQKRSSSLAAC